MSDKEFVSACNCKGKCRCVREPIRTPEQRKQLFIEWLDSTILPTGVVNFLIAKAKEML